MKELFWKKMSLLSVRLIWKMSLQMLSRLFPLTHSWRKKKKKNNLLYLYSPVPWMPWIAPPVTPSPTPTWTSRLHQRRHTDDSPPGRAWQCAGWAALIWGQWGGTGLGESLTSSYSAGWACPPPPRCNEDDGTDHTDAPLRCYCCLAL